MERVVAFTPNWAERERTSRFVWRSSAIGCQRHLLHLVFPDAPQVAPPVRRRSALQHEPQFLQLVEFF